MKVLLSIVLVSLVGQCMSQNARFIVSIAQIQDNVPSFRCVGTAITFRHALTTATCADVPHVVVQIRNVTIGETISESIDTFEVSRVFLHSDWAPARNRQIANIALVHTNREFRIEQLLPRARSVMVTNTTYQLFGWGGALPVNNLLPTFVNVEAFAPQYCNPGLTQSWCSTFLFQNDVACRAPIEGSPVLWNFALVGILLNNNGCAIHGNQFSLSYHSVADFAEWIDETSAAEMTKVSAVVVLSTVFVAFKRIF